MSTVWLTLRCTHRKKTQSILSRGWLALGCTHRKGHNPCCLLADQQWDVLTGMDAIHAVYQLINSGMYSQERTQPMLPANSNSGMYSQQRTQPMLSASWLTLRGTHSPKLASFHWVCSLYVWMKSPWDAGWNPPAPPPPSPHLIEISTSRIAYEREKKDEKKKKNLLHIHEITRVVM